MNLNETFPLLELSVLRKPEWTDVKCGENSKLTVSIIEDNIIWSRPSGVIDLADVRNTIGFVDRLVESQFADGQNYVQIEDCSNLKSVSSDARKYYIGYIKKNQRLSGLIFYNVSPILILSIKLARRLNVGRFDVHIVDDYSKAVKLALDFVSKEPVKPDPISVTEKSQHHGSQVKTEFCPITGLSITCKPEWTDIDLGEGYTVTFKFIGNKILLSIPKGESGEQGIVNLFKEKKKILDSMLLPNETFFELKDYSQAHKKITKAERNQFRVGMREHQDRISGFIGYNAPLSVKLAINVGSKLLKTQFPMSIVQNYETAIKKAIKVLEPSEIQAGARAPEIVSNADWRFQMDDFSVRFEIIDGFIFHADTSGIMEERHLKPLFKVQDRIVNLNPLPKDSYYFIGGVTDVKGSRKARKGYFDYLMQWYGKYPFKMYIFYGANRLLRAAINIASPFSPFPVRMFEDFGSVMRYIAEKEPRFPDPLPIKETASQDHILSSETNRIVDELLHFLGSINWETEGGYDESVVVDSTSPLKPVFDAIELIKMDLDDLLQERKQAEEKIKASLKEKQVMIDEIHHRVKNNMAIIASLLKLQANSIEDNQIKEILKESQSRVYAMSAVHETLHGSENLSEISLKTYLSKITSSIFQIYSINVDKVKLNSDIKEIPIGINQASPLGLVINELISNSLKYAFPDERKGEIDISIQKLDNKLELTIKDDGVGMPEGLNWKNSSSLGLKLVRTLVENQLDGSINMENKNGTKFTIKFNIET